VPLCAGPLWLRSLVRSATEIEADVGGKVPGYAGRLGSCQTILLARTGSEGRSGGEGAGAHAEARAEGRRDVAEEVAAAGAVAVVESGDGDIGAHPLAAGFAERIDALHGKTGQVLHVISLRGLELRFFSWQPHNEQVLGGQTLKKTKLR
jgi:hypothetical protein